MERGVLAGTGHPPLALAQTSMRPFEEHRIVFEKRFPASRLLRFALPVHTDVEKRYLHCEPSVSESEVTCECV